jgi:hypothetical protein
MMGAGRVRTAYDGTESQRASLPGPVRDGLSNLPGPIELDVYLDRDDARRRQVESDALQKLVLARSDIAIHMPLDREDRPSEAERSDDYGRIVVRAGRGLRETRSTSRRELVTLIFEAAGRELPQWTQPSYPGFPVVIEGTRRQCLVALAYVGIPIALIMVGLRLTQRRTAR